MNFCGDCCSMMWTASPARPDHVVIKAGSLDGDALEKLKPKVEVFTSRKPSWVKSLDRAVQVENFTPAPPPQ
jgi:hypothetical protein